MNLQLFAKPGAFFLVSALLFAGAGPAAAMDDNNKKKASEAAASEPSFTDFREAYSAGDAALSAGRYAEAAAAYGQAEEHAQTDEGRSQAANAYGYALMKARRYAEAVEPLERAVRFDPSNKVALSNLGFAHYRKYEFGWAGRQALEKGIEYLELAAKVDPSYKPELLERAKADLAREELYAQATPITEEPAAGMGYKAAVELGDRAQAQGQFDLAVRAFRQAEQDARSPRAKASAANRQGKALLDARKPGEALVHFQRAVELDPEEKVFLNNLGFAYWMLWDSGKGDVEDLKKAVGVFYKVNEMDASYHSQNFWMALSALKETDPEAAKAYEVQEQGAGSE